MLASAGTAGEDFFVLAWEGGFLPVVFTRGFLVSCDGVGTSAASSVCFFARDFLDPLAAAGFSGALSIGFLGLGCLPERLREPANAR